MPSVVTPQPVPYPLAAALLQQRTLVMPNATLMDQDESRAKDAHRFLLLEDDEANALVLEGYLEVLGHNGPDLAVSLSDFEAYRTAIAAGEYDLIFMDVMLPDGESTSIVADVIQTCTTPCIAYTARSGPASRILLQEAGFKAVLEKPLSLQRLDTCLSNILDS